MEEKPQGFTVGMGATIEAPALEGVDWDVLEYMQGLGSLGKYTSERVHPDYHFGLLNSMMNDTGWKLRSGKVSAVTEEDDKVFQEKHNLFLPRTDPPFDASGHMRYRELVWIKYSHQFYESMQKVNLLKSLGQIKIDEGKVAKWREDNIRRAVDGGARLTEKDLQVNIKDSDPLSKVSVPVSEREAARQMGDAQNEPIVGL